MRTKESVLDAVIKTSTINLLARLLGYFKNLTIAVLLGFGSDTDGFFMALSLLGIFIIFVDVFDSVGVPQLVKARQTSEEEFHKLAGLLFSFTLIISFIITLSAFLLMPLVLKVPAGFKAQALISTQNSYLLLLPYLFLNFYFHHFGAVLRSQRRFTAYFFGEFMFSLASTLIIVSGLWLYKDYRVIPVAYSIAQLIAISYILYVCREYIHLHLYYDSTTRKLLKQFLQLLALYGVFHLYIITDKTFASFLEEKSVSALHYGLLLASALRGILKFENIAITSLSEVRANIKKVNFYLAHLIVLTVPISALLFIFSPVVVKILLGHGAFSMLDAELTSTALRFYSLSLPFMFIWPVVYRAFQIREKLLPVGIIALTGVLVNATANYAFVFLLNLGITGICLGTFFAYVYICTLSYAVLVWYNTKDKEGS